MEENILITGVSGFVGSHLALELSKRGYKVYGITKPSTSRDLKVLDEFLRDVAVFTCDISDHQGVHNLLKSINFDIILHLAALTPARDSFEKPFSYVQTNVIGTMNIAHELLKLPDFKEKKLISASSSEVYGIQKKRPITEDVQLNPTSPYGCTKEMIDSYLRMMARTYGLNTTIMRPTNTYGRKVDTSFFVEYVINRMLKGEKIYLGAPDSVRDYMYVDDHVNAYVKAIEHKEIVGEAFNFGHGEPYTNKQVAFKIADMIGYDRKNILLGKYPPNYPLRPIQSDQPFIELDSTKAKKMLNWESKVTLEEGLKKTISYWQQRLGR
jgi:dTDP-glucose 4,6-dehydratase